MAYDIIGDVHGFADRLESLLQKLGSGILLTEARRRWSVWTIAPGEVALLSPINLMASRH